MRLSLRDLRKNYEAGELDEGAAAGVPLRQFEAWFAEAQRAGVPEPAALEALRGLDDVTFADWLHRFELPTSVRTYLATVGADGRPSTRVVLAKQVDGAGVVWFTNYRSRKGRDLDVHPFAALQFHWVDMERVVRIEGEVTRVSDEESDAYFAVRPLDSRLGAWASPQSEVISSRAVLVANAAKVSARYGLHPPRPAHWVVTDWCPRSGSSGRAGRRGSTTGCATAWPATTGCASGWLPEPTRSRRDQRAGDSTATRKSAPGAYTRRSHVDKASSTAKPAAAASAKKSSNG